MLFDHDVSTYEFEPTELGSQSLAGGFRNDDNGQAIPPVAGRAVKLLTDRDWPGFAAMYRRSKKIRLTVEVVGDGYCLRLSYVHVALGHIWLPKDKNYSLNMTTAEVLQSIGLSLIP